MPPIRRLTLRDIAKAAGCHYTTVSLALRNHPSLPGETAQRLRDLARKMGYVPDPMLASLSSYRSSLGAVGFHAILGWVTNHPARNAWRKTKLFVDYYEGARARAKSLGYGLEEFWLRERGMTPSRAAQILQARGITGLIVAPQPDPGTSIDLDWAAFSAVTIGYSLAQPNLHLVGPNQYRAIRQAMHALAARQYRRPGLVMLRASDDRVDNNWTAGFSSGQRALPPGDRLPPLLLDAWDEGRFAAWLKRHEPDAVITKIEEVRKVLARKKGNSPARIGSVFLSLPELAGDQAGIYENPERVGAAAVEYLTGMIHRNERGVPEAHQQLLVEASWVDGRTIRARSPVRAR